MQAEKRLIPRVYMHSARPFFQRSDLQFIFVSCFHASCASPLKPPEYATREVRIRARPRRSFHIREIIVETLDGLSHSLDNVSGITVER